LARHAACRQIKLKLSAMTRDLTRKSKMRDYTPHLFSLSQS
jgi:hypothetical protein